MLPLVNREELPPVSPQTSPRLTARRLTAPRAPSAASRCTHVQLREKKKTPARGSRLPTRRTRRRCQGHFPTPIIALPLSLWPRRKRGKKSPDKSYHKKLVRVCENARFSREPCVLAYAGQSGESVQPWPAPAFFLGLGPKGPLNFSGLFYFHNNFVIFNHFVRDTRGLWIRAEARERGDTRTESAMHSVQ